MCCSEARLAANRRNAQFSTGPKTEEGKTKSRANALTHGLCAVVVVPEDIETLNRRALEVFDSLRPQDSYQVKLVEQIALWSVRIDRAERMERRVRDKVAIRADLFWDDDREIEAEVLGGKLAARPAETVNALRRTPQGCDWLIARWAMLAFAADGHPDHAWTDEQRALAFDLLGTPAEFRAGRSPGAILDDEGYPIESGRDPAVIARGRIDELKGRRDEVSGLDQAERALASADLGTDNDPELKRLRRYENALHRRVRWAVGEVRTDWPYRPLIPDLRPGWVATPEPPREPEPKLEEERLLEAHPKESWGTPFCLTPDEFPPQGERPDFPAIIHSRREKRGLKAESRREARRRKLDRLRG